MGFSSGMCSCKRVLHLSCFLVKWSYLSSVLHESAWKPVKFFPEGEVPPSGTTSCSLLCGMVTAYCTGPDHLKLASAGTGYPSGCALQFTYNHLAIITSLCISSVLDTSAPCIFESAVIHWPVLHCTLNCNTEALPMAPTAITTNGTHCHHQQHLLPSPPTAPAAITTNGTCCHHHLVQQQALVSGVELIHDQSIDGLTGTEPGLRNSICTGLNTLMLDTALNTLMLDTGLNTLIMDTALNLDFASLYIAGDGTTAWTV